MKKFNTKIDILPNYFLNEDGTFNKDAALNLSGKIAGVCYDKEGFNHLVNEPEKNTNRRIDKTLNNGHHSVYDHINISFNLQSVPKMLAMVLNNEHQYTTSEKSARYTPVVVGKDSIITDKEVELYTICLCDWLISLSMVFSRFSHVVAHVRISFFFKVE